MVTQDRERLEDRSPPKELQEGNGKKSTSTSDDEDSLSEDDLFEVLYNARRRVVINYLLDHDGAATTSDLAEHIAANENDVPVNQLSSTQRKRVYVGLYQNHLPKMANLGVIDYDKHRGTVKLRDVADQLEPYLGEVSHKEGWSFKVLGLVAIAGIIVGGSLNAGPAASLPDIVWPIAGLICIFLVALLAVTKHISHSKVEYVRRVRDRGQSQ